MGGGEGGREENNHWHGSRVGGEYNGNKDSRLVIHTMVSLFLLEATDEIEFGERYGNNDDKNNHHHHSNRVSIVGRAATMSSDPMQP